jgi:hypothetical protein
MKFKSSAIYSQYIIAWCWCWRSSLVLPSGIVFAEVLRKKIEIRIWIHFHEGCFGFRSDKNDVGSSGYGFTALIADQLES